MSYPLIFALVCAIAAIAYGAISIRWILAKPAGNPRMQEIAAAVQAGAKAEGAIQTFRWGRQALLSDPFGNGFCFVQWLGRGYGEEA